MQDHSCESTPALMPNSAVFSHDDTPPQPPTPTTIDKLDPTVVREEALELWDGQLRRKTYGGRTYNIVSLRLSALLIDFCMNREGLEFCGDTEAFLISRNPDILLSPFAAVWPVPAPTENQWNTFAPQMVVEYLSETSPRRLANEKKSAWFKAGSREVWFLQEETSSLEIWRPGAPFERHQDTHYQATGITEGLVIDLDELFGGK
ncbi:MAG: Uma2 family endonuclease [Candidatus Sumerlaeia bacterium]|nr:Uma2 family endonuclease [Candidatus Sumerlaeia bacterium]